MPASTKRRGLRKVLKSVLPAAVFFAVVVVLMLFLMGKFHPKVGREGGAGGAPRSAAGVTTAEVRLLQVPVVEPAVGTIRPVQEALVASKLLAKVMAIHIKAGQPVRAGEVLIRLDDADLKARRQQAQALLAAAVAVRDQAKNEYERVARLLQEKAATQFEFERAANALRGAEAQVQQAQQASNEAQTVLDYATITAPIDGMVVDKRVNVGDTATPGQVLLTLYDPTRMQLIASVREALAQRMQVGAPIDVYIESLHKTCTGRISEIVPEAESASRTFQVKVTGPCQPGIYTGMFGRLLIPLDAQEVLVIPRAAVRRVGQLDEVDVVEGAGAAATLRRRAVQLGGTYEDGQSVGVLAGLRRGEKVALEGADHE